MGFVANYLLNLIPVTFGGQPRQPLLFSYYLTHRCNLNCTYCCDGDGQRFREDPVVELSTDDAKQLIAVLARSADSLDITGGEPMLRDDLEEILAEAQAHGMRTVLNTKGIGLQDRPEILKYTDVLVISVDTLELAPLSKLLGRSESTAQQVLDALSFAMAHRDEHDTALVLSSVATPDNLDQVGGVLEYAVKHDIGFHVSPEIVGTAVNPVLRGLDSYRALIDDVLAAKQKKAGVLGVETYLTGIRDFRSFECHPLLMPTIRPDGRIYYPCLESKQAEVSILDAGSYEDALATARERFGPIPECGDCCHIFCHMGLSLLQRSPLSALREGRHWRRIQGAHQSLPATGVEDLSC